jgi:hypothetical protein
MTATAVKGYRSYAAAKKASTWLTAVACGSGDGIPILSEKMSKRVVLDPNDEVDGSSGPLAGDKSSEQYAGQIETYLRYRGLDLLLGMALGSWTTETVDGPASAYRHLVFPTDDREGQFMTLAIDNGGLYVVEYSTCKVTGFTISIKPGKATVSWDIVAGSMAINEATGTNNTTTFASVTTPSGNAVVMFQHMQAYMKLVSDATDFDSGDLLDLSELTVTCKQPHVEDDFTTKNGTLIDEPTADGKWDVTVGMKWRRTSTATGGAYPFFANNADKGKLKAKVALTGPGINAGTTNLNSMVMYFPELQIMDLDSNVGGANVVPTSINLKAHRTTSLPTGFMTGGTTPIAFDILNNLAASPLA